MEYNQIQYRGIDGIVYHAYILAYRPDGSFIVQPHGTNFTVPVDQDHIIEE